jgi:putative transposase
MLGEDGRAETHRRWLVLRAHVKDGVPLTRVAAQSGIPHRTLQRWLAHYPAGGLAGLGPARRPGSFPLQRAVAALG